ncbi:MAG: PH domain-containing protein, partial [Oscillospiraceae bacterium]
NLIRNLKFSATRHSNLLCIKSGLLTKRQWDIATTRINLIELRQNFLTKIFSFYIALIHCNGYGKKKDELSVLIPAGRKTEITQTIKLLLPEIPICESSIRPKIRYLSRFLIPPISWIFGVLIGTIILNYFFPRLYDIIIFIRIMAFIPCFCFLGVKIISYLHTGIGLSNDVYTFRFTYIFTIKTVAVPKKRIVKMQIRQSLFQVMSGCCDLVVYTYCESKKRHVIPNLNYEQVLLLLKDDIK